MKLVVNPGAKLRGQGEVPGDKSISHRLALFAAMATGRSQIDNFLDAGVTRAMLASFPPLGVSWQLQAGCLTLESPGLLSWKAPDAALDCGNSGTTLRLLAGALAAAGIPAVLTGSPGLRRRPMARIVTPLQEMGVPVQAAPGGLAPLSLQARHHDLQALSYQLPVASAQVKTCLLLAALAASEPTTLIEPSLSRDHTERLLGALGVAVDSRADPSPAMPTAIRHTLHPPKPLRLPPFSARVPGDFSAAAFVIVAALITPGSEVTLPGIGLNPTRTGLLDVLREMGANLEVTNEQAPDRQPGLRSASNGEPQGMIIARYSPDLRPVSIQGQQVVRMIDEFPAFAIAASFARGKTVVAEAGELRHKESDRIAALCAGLRALGIQASETPDGFSIEGGQLPHGGQVQSYGDHRLAMAFSLAGLAATAPVTVRDTDVIAESFPRFSAVLQGLGANLREYQS